MIITEEELRQAWRNGRGQIPAFPPGTRFTPAAQDFLRGREVAPACPAAPAEAAPPRAARRELQAPPGQRLIFTAQDVAGLLAGAPSLLVVHGSVTITHAALELLRAAGVRVIPHVEDAPAQPVADGQLFRQAREAVLARLDRPVDPAVLDAILKRVLAAL